MSTRPEEDGPCSPKQPQPTAGECWANVGDVGPSFSIRWASVPYQPGSFCVIRAQKCLPPPAPDTGWAVPQRRAGQGISPSIELTTRSIYGWTRRSEGVTPTPFVRSQFIFIVENACVFLSRITEDRGVLFGDVGRVIHILALDLSWANDTSLGVKQSDSCESL